MTLISRTTDDSIWKEGTEANLSVLHPQQYLQAQAQTPPPRTQNPPNQAHFHLLNYLLTRSST